MSDLPRSFELDWTDGVSLKGDIIPARTYVERSIVSIQPTKARLVLSDHSVRNELGGHMVRGYARLGGKQWTIIATAQGKTTQLTLAPTSEDEKSAEQFALNGIVDPLDGRTALTLVREPLAEGEFLVELSDSPFLPTGGLPLTMNPSVHVVRGELSR